MITFGGFRWVLFKKSLLAFALRSAEFNLNILHSNISRWQKQGFLFVVGFTSACMSLCKLNMSNIWWYRFLELTVNLLSEFNHQPFEE